MTIPNLAPDMNAHALTREEFEECMSEDMYYWVELRHDNYGVDEDEVFHLRLHIIQRNDVDFSTPMNLLNCALDDYGITWRVWNLCPTDDDTYALEWAEDWAE